jgi:hypothetical protein
MHLGDFSSVVQLGVGLHAGTALLQSVAEFTGTPLSRRIERLKSIADIKAQRDRNYNNLLNDARDLLGDLELKKIQFFNVYKRVVVLNAGVAIALAILLAVIAIFAKSDISGLEALSIIAASFLPAAGSIWFLRSRWITNTKELSRQLLELERKLLGVGN